jgi:tetratricopeptide (TPR) repeat protein
MFMQNEALVVLFAAIVSAVLISHSSAQGEYLDDHFREAGRESALVGKLASLVRDGVSDCENKQYDRGISSFTAALQLKPDSMVAAQIYNVRGQAYGKGKRDFKKAFADANEAIRLDPRLAEAYNTRGVALLSLGDTTKALTDFETALRLKPGHGPAQRNRALILSHKK